MLTVQDRVDSVASASIDIRIFSINDEYVCRPSPGAGCPTAGCLSIRPVHSGTGVAVATRVVQVKIQAPIKTPGTGPWPQ